MKENKLNLITLFKNKSALLVIIAIFSIMIAFPIFIFGYFSNYYIIKNSNEKDQEYAHKSLEYTLNSFSNYLSQIENVMFYTYLEINQNILTSDILSKSEYTKMNIIEKLKNFKQTNSNIVSILYTDNSKYVFSSESGYSEYISHPLKESLLSSDLKETSQLSWYSTEIPVYNPEKDTFNTISTISHTVKFASNTNRLVVSLSVEYINSILSDLAVSNSLQIIFDSNNKIIAFTGSNSTKNKMENLILNLGHNDTDLKSDKPFSLDGVDYRLTILKSDMIGWKFINLTPVKILYKHAYYVRSIALLSSLSCILIGLSVMLIVYFKFYRPLWALRNRISTISNFGSFKGKNEFGLIRNAVNTLLDDNTNIRYRLGRNYAILKEYFLKNLLEKQDSPVLGYDINIYKEYINLVPDTSDFVVCLVDYSFPEKNLKDPTYQTNTIAIFRKEIELDYKLFELVRTSEGLAIILQKSSDSQNPISFESIHALLLRTVKKIHVFSGYSCSIGVGNIVNSVSDLDKSFRNSLFALHYSIIEDKNKVYFSDDLKPYDDSNNGATTEFNSSEDNNLSIQIIESLSSKGENGTVELFQHLISPYCDKQSFSFSHIMLYYEKFIKSLLKYIVENNIHVNSKTLLVELMSVKSLSEMITNLYSLTDIILRHSSEDNNLNIINSVVEYINVNYSVDITLENIAEKVFISPNYLSKLFKKYYGINFNKYIISKRIDVAEKLLATTNMKIHHIALKVGYKNLNSFTKMFK